MYDLAVVSHIGRRESDARNKNTSSILQSFSATEEPTQSDDTGRRRKKARVRL